MPECRVCGAWLHSPILTQNNMPAIAQFLPQEHNLEQDKGIDILIHQCPSCGLVQLSNEPVYYYKEVVRSAGFSKEMVEFRTAQFKSFAGRFSGGELLEIGCGAGEYLSIMSEFVPCYGIEYSESNINICRQKGLRVGRTFLSKQSPYARVENDVVFKFDGFFIMNFLEHIPKPSEFLRLIGENLKPNAIGLVEVPNFDLSLKELIFTDFSTEHLSYFSQDTLRRTLEMSGFQVLSMDIVWHENIISAVVQKRQTLDLSCFDKASTILQNELSEFLNTYKDKKVVVWGAGHQSLATLALTGLAYKFSYVVDSAPFKQGRYTPVTHLQIKSPQSILEDEIEVVVVNATSYSDEVVRILQSEYSCVKKIAVIKNYQLIII